MAWYYVTNGTSQGPVSEPEIRRLRSQNVIALDTPIWTEGMAEWIPFQQSPLGAVATPGGVPVATHTCAECARVFPEDEMLQYENSWVCATCKPVFFQRIKEGVAPRGTLIYATVGRRFAAVLLDGIVLVLVIILPVVVLMSVMIALSAKNNNGTMPAWFMAPMLILEYGLPAAYEIFFIGKYGATPGKMLLKVKVVGPDGQKISYGRATGRYFAKMLSYLTLYIGFLMAFWDDEKRTLHDRICQTRVVSSEG